MNSVIRYKKCEVKNRNRQSKIGKEDFIQGYYSSRERPELNLNSTPLQKRAGRFLSAGMS